MTLVAHTSPLNHCSNVCIHLCSYVHLYGMENCTGFISNSLFSAHFKWFTLQYFIILIYFSSSPHVLVVSDNASIKQLNMVQLFANISHILIKTALGNFWKLPIARSNSHCHSLSQQCTVITILGVFYYAQIYKVRLYHNYAWMIQSYFYMQEPCPLGKI